jgi:DNA topoisomerase IA
MEINLNLDPAEIAKKLTEALTNQAFSELFKKAVEDELKEITKSTYNTDSVMRRVVKQFMEQQMYKVLNEEYSEKAKELIRQKLEESGKLEEYAGKLMDGLKFDRY